MQRNWIINITRLIINPDHALREALYSLCAADDDYL